jgi:hypothetical protein
MPSRFWRPLLGSYVKQLCMSSPNVHTKAFLFFPGFPSRNTNGFAESSIASLPVSALRMAANYPFRHRWVSTGTMLSIEV